MEVNPSMFGWETWMSLTFGLLCKAVAVWSPEVVETTFTFGSVHYVRQSASAPEVIVWETTFTFGSCTLCPPEGVCTGSSRLRNDLHPSLTDERPDETASGRLRQWPSDQNRKSPNERRPSPLAIVRYVSQRASVDRKKSSVERPSPQSVRTQTKDQTKNC